MMKILFMALISFSINVFSGDKNESNKSINSELVLIKIDEKKAPDFALKSLDGKTVKLSDYKGKVVIIDFWATWCKPCNKPIPELNKVYELYKEKGLEIIGINCDGPRSISKVGPMAKSLQIQYPVLIDINTEVMNDLNLMAYPTLLMVNSEGKILWIHEGYVTGDTELIMAEIDENLKAL